MHTYTRTYRCFGDKDFCIILNLEWRSNNKAFSSIKASHCNKLGGQRHSRSQQSSRRSTQQTRHAQPLCQHNHPENKTRHSTHIHRWILQQRCQKRIPRHAAQGHASLPWANRRREGTNPKIPERSRPTPRYKPTWELSALWHSGEWVLIAEPNPKDRTDITLYIQQSKKELFATHFPEAWAQWWWFATSYCPLLDPLVWRALTEFSSTSMLLPVFCFRVSWSVWYFSSYSVCLSGVMAWMSMRKWSCGL